MKKHIFALIISGPLKGQNHFYISENPILIGRGKEANIRISYDRYCSRKHALLFWENNICMIKDLESTNGTYINENRINKPTILKEGDVIRIGATKIVISTKDNEGDGTVFGYDPIFNN